MSNADVVYWTTFGKHLKRVRTDMTQIGTAFYTKKMGSSQTDFEDLTSNYKYAEKSEAERWAMRTAGYQMMLPFLYDDEVKLRAENETVGFRFIHSPNQIWGNNVTLTYQLFNKKSAPIKVNFTFHVDLIHYNGVSLKTLKFNRQVISLAKRESKLNCF